MKLLKPFTFLILVLTLITNCSKGKEENLELIDPEHEINLISPVNTIEENFSFNFVWETNSDQDPVFQLGSGISLDHPIIESTLSSSETNYNLTRTLAPNSTFYWKISLDSDYAIGSFQTKDIITPYGGVYEMVVEESYRDDDGFFDYDTTYLNNIELIILNDKVQIESDHGFSGEILSFREDLLNENTLEYENIISPWHYEVSLHIPLDRDTIYAYKRTGGLGSYTKWIMRGVKIE